MHLHGGAEYAQFGEEPLLTQVVESLDRLTKLEGEIHRRRMELREVATYEVLERQHKTGVLVGWKCLPDTVDPRGK
jgi:hypothetical protein